MKTVGEHDSTAARGLLRLGLVDLISAELISPCQPLTGTRSGNEFRATVLPDGRIRTEDGAEFDTLSGAADMLTTNSNNGWEFWQVERGGENPELARIREKYLADRLAEAEDE